MPTIKTFLPTSLFGRTLLILIAPMILLQFAAAAVFFDRHWIKITERLSYAVAGEIAAIAQHIEQSGAEPEALANIRAVMATHLEILISYTPGEELAEPTTDMTGQTVSDFLARALEEQVRRPYRILVSHPTKRVDIWVQLEDGVLQATMPERRIYSSSGYIFILWLIGLSFVFFTISVVLMRNQIRPVLRLAIAADRLGKGRDVSFFKPTGAREVRQAAEAFLKMRDRIRRQIEQRTTMLAGVSHDLRTPITRMKLQLAMMDDASPDIRDLKADLQEMEIMVDAYLAFAKGQDDEATQGVDMNAFVAAVAARFDRDGQGREGQGIDIRLSFTRDIAVRRNQMDRALSNIIGNAVKYGEKIEISGYTDTEAEEAVLVVADHGPGIPADERENVFRPFYRLESSRNKKSGGVGLGLSIAQDIVAAHGGAITLSDTNAAADPAHRGLTVTIRLPL